MNSSEEVESFYFSSKVNMSTSSTDYVEGVVCQVSDLKENELKTFDLDEGKVLLVKQNGKINALGTKCTHYGAPLVSGAVGDGRIRCQWHGACFNIATGDIEEYPGLDSLNCYQVSIEDDKVKVRARKSDLRADKRVKQMVQRNKNDAQHFVVVGGGPAGATCVEVLRQEGYTGLLTMICKENCLPYDRIKVTKAMNFDIDKVQFRDDKFYKQHGIDVLKGVEATGIETASKTVSLSTGSNLPYDKLFIATGSKPRKITIPGSELKNVVTLRTYEDGKFAYSLLSEDKEVVVLGASFIAMETAYFCQSKVKKVTVVLRDSLPLKPLLGPEIGAAILKLFEDKNVQFVKNSGITKINDDGKGNAVSVVLNDGTALKADLVVMGVGSTFNTEFLKDSGIETRADGSVETDEYLQTNLPDVFVGGDIAYAPVWSNGNRKSAIGHFGLSHYHGKMAALNLLGKREPLRVVPYFWTVLFGKSIRYAGHGSYDEIIYAGNVSELKFVAFYLQNDEVVAASSCSMDPVVSQFAERLSQGRKLHKDDLKNDPLAWTKK